MNKLEEQIDKKSSDWVSDHQHERAFEEGAQFVIDLELPEKFAEYMGLNFNFDGVYWSPKGNLHEEIGVIKSYGNGTTLEMRKFWIENIYGK